jgi:elongation factor G
LKRRSSRAVPKNYFPAVEKGFIESTEHGLLSGFPVIGIKAVLLDGKYHPVDSNELAFKMASILAFKEAYMNCGPTLLEPIMKIMIRVGNEFTAHHERPQSAPGRVLSIEEKAMISRKITRSCPNRNSDYAIRLRFCRRAAAF